MGKLHQECVSVHSVLLQGALSIRLCFYTCRPVTQCLPHTAIWLSLNNTFDQTRTQTVWLVLAAWIWTLLFKYPCVFALNHFYLRGRIWTHTHTHTLLADVDLSSVWLSRDMWTVFNMKCLVTASFQTDAHWLLTFYYSHLCNIKQETNKTVFSEYSVLCFLKAKLSPLSLSALQHLKLRSVVCWYSKKPCGRLKKMFFLSGLE